MRIGPTRLATAILGSFLDKVRRVTRYTVELVLVYIYLPMPMPLPVSVPLRIYNSCPSVPVAPTVYLQRDSAALRPRSLQSTTRLSHIRAASFPSAPASCLPISTTGAHMLPRCS